MPALQLIKARFELDDEDVSDTVFYFCRSFDQLDRLLLAREHKIPPDDAALERGMPSKAISMDYRDFDGKNRSTWHPRCMPLSLDLK